MSAYDSASRSSRSWFLVKSIVELRGGSKLDHNQRFISTVNREDQNRLQGLEPTFNILS